MAGAGDDGGTRHTSHGRYSRCRTFRPGTYWQLRWGADVKVLVLPADDGGVGHYRLTWPGEALIAQGADVTVAGVEDDSGLHGLYMERDHGPDELMALEAPPDADVVVVQRPLQRDRVRLIRLLQLAGARVVVEIDDDFGALHPRNVSWRSCHPQHSPHRNWVHLSEACHIADLVTCSTPALAERYGRHGRVVVIPNHVPERYLTIERDLQAGGPFVGWTGSIQTHPTDLQVTRGAVQRAMAGSSAMFVVVGPGTGVREALSLDEPPLTAGWLPLDRYPEAMAQLDVGIAPLDDIAFNQGKSWLKGLEYAALGVPFVASTTEDYVRLHARGAGLLAAKPKDWVRHLRRLIGSEDERADLAAAGRAVAAGLTIEGNADRWWDAWSSCLNARSAA